MPDRFNHLSKEENKKVLKTEDMPRDDNGFSPDYIPQ
jgi:hypothetical protein